MKLVDNSLKTNWKYLAIVVVLGLVAGTGTTYLVVNSFQVVSNDEAEESKIPKERMVEQKQEFSKKLGEWPSIGPEDLGELNISLEELYEVRFDATLNHYVVWRPYGWRGKPQPLFLDGIRMPHNIIFDYVFSKDGKKFAYIARENDEKFVVFEGRSGKRYKNIASPPFFLTEGTFLYAAEDSQGSYIVKDGVQTLVDGKFWGSRLMNDHIIYTVLGGKKKSTLFLDGREVDKERPVDIVQISSDGKHILYGYTGDEDDSDYVMYEGVEYRYERIGLVKLHEDGQFAFGAYDDKLKKQFLVVNGKEQRDRLCDVIGIHFDTKGGIAYLCINELPAVPYDPLSWSTSAIQPRQLHTYSFIWNGKEVYTIADKLAPDGLSWDRVDFLWDVTFNKDNTLVAFTVPVEHWSHDSTMGLSDSKKTLVVINGVVKAEHVAVRKLIEISFAGFTRDNKLVYTILETIKPDKASRLFIEGDEIKWKGDFLSAGPFLLEDGRIVAITREADGRTYYVVVDGAVKSSYEKIFSNSVSLRDGKLVFGARRGNEVWRIVEELE